MDVKNQECLAYMVRDFGQIKNIIIPLCYKKLQGYKAIQFEDWIEKMESDSKVPTRFKLLPKLCKSGFYERNGKF